jgi:hypothetical protein
VPALQPRGAAHQRTARRGCLPRRPAYRRRQHWYQSGPSELAAVRVVQGHGLDVPGDRRRHRRATQDVHRRRCYGSAPSRS